jgi:hypothetical protein
LPLFVSSLSAFFTILASTTGFSFRVLNCLTKLKNTTIRGLSPFQLALLDVQQDHPYFIRFCFQVVQRFLCRKRIHSRTKLIVLSSFWNLVVHFDGATLKFLNFDSTFKLALANKCSNSKHLPSHLTISCTLIINGQIC